MLHHLSLQKKLRGIWQCRRAEKYRFDVPNDVERNEWGRSAGDPQTNECLLVCVCACCD